MIHFDGYHFNYRVQNHDNFENPKMRENKKKILKRLLCVLGDGDFKVILNTRE